MLTPTQRFSGCAALRAGRHNRYVERTLFRAWAWLATGWKHGSPPRMTRYRGDLAVGITGHLRETRWHRGSEPGDEAEPDSEAPRQSQATSHRGTSLATSQATSQAPRQADTFLLARSHRGSWIP